MRWAFIRPANRSPYYDPEIQEPLGLEYLAADRKGRGDSVLVLDASLDQGGEVRLARRAAAFQPDVVGFSLTTAQEGESVLTMIAECAASLRSHPVRWLAGGNYVSTEPLHAARLLPPDFELIRFEGERALEEFAQEWQRSPRLPAAGPVVPPAADRIRLGRFVPDLDTLPFPQRPFAPQILSRGWALNIQGSRGCCGACHYCSSPGMFAATKGRWRGRSPENVVEELAGLGRSHGAQAFNFVDEDFLGPNHLAPIRAAAFADEIVRRDLRISFGIQVRPSTLNEEIIDRLTAAGLTYVFMGIESDDREDFKRWNRPFTPDPWRFVPRLRERGAELNAGVLLFHSHSTLAGIRRFATTLREHGLLEYRSARNRLDAMPGSVFHARGIEAGTFSPLSTGPQALPFDSAAVERFYQETLTILDPIGPPAMQAVCALPPLLSQRRLTGEDRLLKELLAILAALDAALAHSFFALLDAHERGTDRNGLTGSLRNANLQAALAAAQQLERCGLASQDQLREAIRLDCGM